MTEPISDEAVLSLGERHVEGARAYGRTLCDCCDYLWPCPVAALIARLRAAEADRDAALARAVPEGWRIEVHGDPDGGAPVPVLVPLSPEDTEGEKS